MTKKKTNNWIELLARVFYPNKYNVTLTIIVFAIIFVGASFVPYFTLKDLASRLPSGSAFRALEAAIFAFGIFALSSVVAYKMEHEKH